MENYEPAEKSKFNQASAILQQVDYIKFQANEAFRKGDLEKWFFEWRNIKYQLIGKMKKETIRDLTKLESKINFLLKRTDKNKRYVEILILLIEKYLVRIQKFIEASGMGLINKEDESIFT